MNMIDTIAATASKAIQPQPGDYRKDGLLYCGKCHSPKEKKITPPGTTETRIVRCVCKCNQEPKSDGKRIAALQQAGGISPAFTFANAESSKAIDACKRYAEKWKQMAAKNIGLLLWGGVGTGKTFAAHCICNALIEQDIPAYATSLSKVLNSGFDKTEILKKVKTSPLAVFDDLGAERSSDYALETVFMLVDERYRSGRPLIVTTNLTLEELKNPADISRKRIYDRILGQCVPVQFDGGSKRVEKAAEMLQAARELLAGG